MSIMGKQGSLIDPVLEAKAAGLMALDYLCPDPSHRWARLHLAVAHWHRLDPDPKVNSQGKLAEKVKNKKTGKSIRASQLSGARKPPKGKKRNGCGLDDDYLKQAAKIIGVEPDWLLQGYSPNGQDIWPDWTADATASARKTLTDILVAYLNNARQSQPVPSFIADMLRPYFPILEADAILPIDAPIPSSVVASDRAELIQSLLGSSDGVDLWQTIRAYIASEGLTVSAYLRRHRHFLAPRFQHMIQSKQVEMSEPHRLSAVEIDRYFPHIPVQRWLKELSTRLQTKIQ